MDDQIKVKTYCARHALWMGCPRQVLERVLPDHGGPQAGERGHQSVPTVFSMSEVFINNLGFFWNAKVSDPLRCVPVGLCFKRDLTTPQNPICKTKGCGNSLPRAMQSWISRFIVKNDLSFL